jgi:dolichyl-phosphate-mannose-protein mannosyltransferase
LGLAGATVKGGESEARAARLRGDSQLIVSGEIRSPSKAPVGAALAVLAVLYYIGIAWLQSSTALGFDEIEWGPHAEAVLRRGAPVLEENDWRLMVSPDSHVARMGGRSYGLWHPPLYMFALAGHVAVFGASTTSLRLFGVLCLLATLALTGRLAYSLARRAGMEAERASLCASLAVGLLALNPYSVQGSLFVDIDTTLLVPVQLVFFSALFTWIERASRARAMAVVVSIALMLWTKVTTPLILLVVTEGYLLVNRQRRLALSFGALAIAGMGLFAGSWWIYAQVTGVPFEYPFVTTHANRAGMLWGASLYERLNSLRYYVTWMSFPLILLWLIAIVGRARDVWGGRRMLPVDLMGLDSLAILLFYGGLVGTNGKYVVPAVPLISLVISWYLIDANVPKPLGAHVGWTALVVSVGGVLLHALVVPDILTRPPISERLAPSSLGEALTDPLLPRYALSLVPLVLSAIVLRVASGSRQTLWAACAGGLLTLAPANVIQNAALSGLRFPLYPSTETGFHEATRILNQEARPESIIVGMKDLLPLLTKGRLIPLDREFTWRWNYKVDLGAAKALSLFAGCPRVEFLVENVPSPFWRNQQVREALEKNFEAPVKIGNFYRLSRARPGSCGAAPMR